MNRKYEKLNYNFEDDLYQLIANNKYKKLDYIANNFYTYSNDHYIYTNHGTLIFNDYLQIDPTITKEEMIKESTFILLDKFESLKDRIESFYSKRIDDLFLDEIIEEANNIIRYDIEDNIIDKLLIFHRILISTIRYTYNNRDTILTFYFLNPFYKIKDKEDKLIKHILSLLF